MKDCVANFLISTNTWPKVLFTLSIVSHYNGMFATLLSKWNFFFSNWKSSKFCYSFGKKNIYLCSYLYTILADNALSATPILILCNKQDATMAKGSVVIQNLLEKEL